MTDKVNYGYVILFLLSIMISSISHVMLRKSAMKRHRSKLSEYLNPLVMGAYIIFFGATFLTMIAYRAVPLSVGPILEASGYIFVGIFSFLFLNEKISGRKLLGMIIIIVGIGVYSI